MVTSEDSVITGDGMTKEDSAVLEKIQQLLKSYPVMLFMKGSPEQPRCGFSARVVQILQALDVKFNSFDVLTDEKMRAGIKKHAQWPTIPQLYINQEFIGGCDIIQEQWESGELEKQLSSFKNSQLRE